MRCLGSLLVALATVPAPAAVPEQSKDPPSQERAEYLERSRRQRKLDRDSLEAEMKAQGLKEPLQAPEGGSPDPGARKPAAWHGSEEALRAAGAVISFQTPSGGWSKAVDMAGRPRRPGERYCAGRDWSYVGTIDNGATVGQLRFLSRVQMAAGGPAARACRESFLRGIEYLLLAQYPGGGWPQVYPLQGGYHDHITFNDGAMVNVLALLRDVARKAPEVSFVDEGLRARAEEALRRGVGCILKCQVLEKGRRTVWCAQHDAVTLAPASARSYEKESLSGGESAGVVRFLLGIERPGPEVIEAVQAAAEWFEASKLLGIREVKRPDPSLPRGHDKVIVQDPAAGPLWARFYEIGTGRPIFCGRDGAVKYSLAEIEHERRVGYAWYTDAPARLLEKEIPEWRRKWTRER